MLVTDKFVFVHDPKQGGSFISAALFRIHGAKWNALQHLRASVFKRISVKSKYGEFIVLSPGLKHAGCARIPAEFRDRAILTTIRNPYDWYVSQYEFGWWKKKSMLKYFRPVPNFENEYKKFPELDFTEFMKLTDQAFSINFNCPKEILYQFGWRTRSFIDYYFKNPSGAFSNMMAEDYISSGNYKSDLFDGLHFISTKDLNQNLHSFLVENGYEKADVDFILEMKKVLPLGKGRTKEQKWEKYFSPELKAEIRQKDRILFEMFPEFDT